MDLGKSRLHGKPERLPRIERYYHWYDEDVLRNLHVDTKGLRYLLDRLSSSDTSGRITEEERLRLLDRLEEATESGGIKVVTLLEVCDVLDVDPEELERMRMFERGFPIYLEKPEIYKLMTHIINEGVIQWKKNPRSSYYNMDSSLCDRVSELVESLGGRPTLRLNEGKYPEVQLDATTTRILVKAGIVPGKKSRGQYLHHLPEEILKDPDLSKYHISTTIAEEGWSSLVLNLGQRPDVVVGYSRSIDVTETLPKEYLDSLELKKKYSPGQIPDGIRAELLLHPFPLQRDEIGILIKKLDVKVYTNLVSLYKSTQGRVTVEWRVTIRGAEAVKRFADRFGFLPGSDSERKFRLIWKLYEENRDRRLGRDDIDRLRKDLRRT